MGTEGKKSKRILGLVGSSDLFVACWQDTGLAEEACPLLPGHFSDWYKLIATARQVKVIAGFVFLVIFLNSQSQP